MLKIISAFNNAIFYTTKGYFVKILLKIWWSQINYLPLYYQKNGNNEQKTLIFSSFQPKTGLILSFSGKFQQKVIITMQKWVT